MEGGAIRGERKGMWVYIPVSIAGYRPQRRNKGVWGGMCAPVWKARQPGASGERKPMIPRYDY